MEALLHNYFTGILEHPNMFVIQTYEHNGETHYTLHAHPDDKKRIIGPRGLVIKNLQTLANNCFQNHITLHVTK